MKQTLIHRQQRHDYGWLPLRRSLQVPLLATGEKHRGYFRVPASAVTFKPHTNEVLKYDRVVVQKVAEWVTWKARLGWVLQGKPRVLAPVPEPTVYGGEETGEMRVYVEGTFSRRVPLHVPLESFLERRDEYRRYRLDEPAERLVENPLPQPVEHIEADGVLDPMKAAEQRRREVGMRRELIVKDGVAVEAKVVPMTTGETETE